MFVDRAQIQVVGGAGGDGCVSFRREKYVPRGGPDGGDGGDGGSVILRAVTGEQSLVNFRFQQHWEAKGGVQGMGKGRHGAKGKDRIGHVPIGTLVIDQATGALLADLTTAGQEFIAASGGKHGLGNARFATSTRRVPRISTPGEPGEERRLRLELKTIADVGLVGYPNAGKSTLITAMTDAHPKTAPYPFTTLHPVVGTIEFPDFYRYTVADIPGLIDGAHENVGLGHEFLRHIERCRMLVYVLDMDAVDGRYPWNDFDALQNELNLHQPGLADRPAVIAANKMDMDNAPANLETLRSKTDLDIVPLTALIEENTDTLVQLLRRRLKALNATPE